MMKSLSLLALVAAGAVAQKPARSVFIKCLFSDSKVNKIGAAIEAETKEKDEMIDKTSEY